MTTVHNLKQFNREVSNFAKTLVPEKVKLFQKRTALEALQRIVDKTPVDTGRAQGNWQLTIGSVAQGEIEVSGRSAEEVIQKGIAVLTALKPFEVIYISNNVNYIVYLEEGSSQQAPAGMVAVTVEELMQMFP